MSLAQMVAAHTDQVVLLAGEVQRRQIARDLTELQIVRAAAFLAEQRAELEEILSRATRPAHRGMAHNHVQPGSTPGPATNWHNAYPKGRRP